MMNIKNTLTILVATSIVSSAATTYTIGSTADNRASTVQGTSFVISETGGAAVTGIPSGEYANLAALSGAAITLDSFSFVTSSSGGSQVAGGTDYYLQIYSDQAGTTLLTNGTSTNTFDIGASGNNTTLGWTFSSLTLDADTTYYALISTTTAAGTIGDAAFNLTTTGTTYGSGQLVRSTNGVGSNWDLEFSATATATPVLVPEPSSMALLGLGALALIVRRR